MSFTVEQLGAITAYRRMVELVSLERPITSRYDPTGLIRSTGALTETRAEQRLDAKRRLAELEREVFFNKRRAIRSLFDDIVINDMSAETAGAHIFGRNSRATQIAVRTLVASIADEIDIVLQRRF